MNVSFEGRLAMDASDKYCKSACKRQSREQYCLGMHVLCHSAFSIQSAARCEKCYN